MTNQILFGEVYRILEKRAKWWKVRTRHDAYVGWISANQGFPIEDEVANENKKPSYCAYDLVNYLEFGKPQSFSLVTLGAPLPNWNEETLQGSIGKEVYDYKGEALSCTGKRRSKVVEAAHLFLNTPYLWGGRSPLGIDCSGLTQLAYRIGGIHLPRDAWQQAEKGKPLSFVEEAKPGDLAFFDNAEGKITHVGILLENHQIIHASGRVRRDSIDQTGIYNAALRSHTHKLRVIKKVF
jgi:hypothetical protein